MNSVRSHLHVQRRARRTSQAYISSSFVMKQRSRGESLTQSQFLLGLFVLCQSSSSSQPSSPPFRTIHELSEAFRLSEENATSSRILIKIRGFSGLLLLKSGLGPVSWQRTRIPKLPAYRVRTFVREAILDRQPETPRSRSIQVVQLRHAYSEVS